VSLPGLLVRVDRLLADLQVPHAFGGALALAYYAEPRATQDIDVNVFLLFQEAGAVVSALDRHGLRAEAPPSEWLPIGGIALREVEENRRIGLFFSLDAAYDEVQARVRRFPFGRDEPVELPILSAEDLMVFKVSFGRPQDWFDIESMLDTNAGIDLPYIERKLTEIRGPTMRSRLARLTRMVERQQ
jgi:hypothetical protein